MKKGTLCIAVAIMLAMSIVGLTGCGSANSGKTSNTSGSTTNATTTASGPYDGDWTLVASLSESGAVSNASGTAIVTGSSISINGTIAGKSISVTGKYESKQDGKPVYKLDDGSGIAIIGQSSTGPKPYAIVMPDSNGSPIVAIVEKTTSPNKFSGSWKLNKVISSDGTFSGSDFERMTGGSFSVKITSGGYAIMSFGGKMTLDTYTTSGNTLTIVDADDGSRIPFTLSGGVLKIEMDGETWELTKD